MARLAIIDIKTNRVINIAEADEINPIDGFISIFSDTANIGDFYNGFELIPEPKRPPPPLSIDMQISILEAKQTPRRIRESVLSENGSAWLKALNEEISILRSKIKP